MEKIMSKSNDSSKLGRAPQVQELRDDELQEVSGGASGQHLAEVTLELVSKWNWSDGWPTH
jgi:bacteriocin-like protein